MNDNELEELFGDEESNDMELNRTKKRIKRGINRRIYVKVIEVLVVISIIVTGGYYSLYYGLNLIYYNPGNETGFAVTDERAYGFNILMGSYLSMNYPGIVYIPIEYNEQGFGNYEISALIQSAFEVTYVAKEYSATLTLSKSTIDIVGSKDLILTRIIGEYHDEAVESTHNYVTDYNIADIEELPESAILDASLSFLHTLPIEDAVSFMRKYDDSSFVWLATGNSTTGTIGIAKGISLYDATGYSLNRANSSIYPNLTLPDDYTASDLVENYLSRMKLLLDHEEFLDLVNTYFSYGGTEDNAYKRYNDLSQQYQDVLENGVSCIGVRGYIKKQDLLTMLDNNELYGLYINKVKLSKYLS